MAPLVAQTKYGMGKNGYKIRLSLIEFEEDGVTIIYAPALDLSGYGNTEIEAKESFNIVMEEFLQYTHSKNTLNGVLSELGWEIKVSSKNAKYSPPKNSDLVDKNPLYKEILDKKQYKVFSKEVKFEYD